MQQQQQQQQTNTSHGNGSGRDDGANAHMMVLDVGSMATALAGGAGGSSASFSGQQQQQQQQQQQVMPTSTGVYDHSMAASGAAPVLSAPVLTPAGGMTTPTPTREVPNPLHAVGLYDASIASTNGFSSDSQTSTPVQLRVAPSEQQQQQPQQAAPPPFQHPSNAFQQQLRPAEHAASAVSSAPASSSIPPFFASMPALAGNAHPSSQVGQMAPPPAPPPTPTGNAAHSYPFPNALPSHVTKISNSSNSTSGSHPQQGSHGAETALRIQSSASNHSSSSSHGSPASSNGLQQQQQQHSGSHALPPLLESRQLTQEAMKWANGSEIALKAAEELAVAYNKIAGILSKGLAIDMTTRLDIRQDFVQAVAALDKAFFLSPAGPGYIGVQTGSAGATAGSRKRAFTVNSADDGTTDDPNKHRRTTSDAISAFSDVAPSHASSLLISPRSASSSAPARPALHHHTHSSPLLPVESHYRPNSAGISDVTPAPKAADLATSGSHHVGKLHQHQPVMATHMSQSMLAADEEMPTHSSQAEQQQQEQRAQQAFLGVHDPLSQSMTLQRGTTAQHFQSQQHQQEQQMPMQQTQPQAQTQIPQGQQQPQFTMSQQGGPSHAQVPLQTMQQQAPPIIAPIPQMPMVTSRDLSSMQAAFMAQQGKQLQPPLDPQAYAQQALRTQDFLLAQAGSSLEPAFEPIQIPISQSSTPTPYQQQAYITPPMPDAAQFETQHMQMGYGDTDMSTGEASQQVAPQQQQQQQQALHQTLQQQAQHHAPQQTLGPMPGNGVAQGSAVAQSTRSTAHHPGQLDFTTLRNPPAFGSSLNGVKHEDSSFDTSITSPYASSHMSMSSFPFTAGTSGTSVTSSSRSRAASLSKAVSASRSRAPSMGSMPAQQGGPMMQTPHFYPGPPDAHELENILGNLTSLPSPIHEDDDDEEDDSYFENQNHLNSSSCSSLSDLANNFSSSQIEQSPHSGYGAGSKMQVAASASGPPGQAMGMLGSKEKDKDKDANSPELTAAFNDIFAQWLPTICADPDATDRKSERIHQPLMAKKMQKLDEEHAFRPFKFRIQPFTNSFQDACKDHGLVEPEVAVKHVKNYLWNQPLISRFNDEGKKTKSRGNHVWSIEARYLEPGKYDFRPPPPKIVPVPTPAAPGLLWTWTPKVLDSQIQGSPMDARFSCTNTPSWLEWNDGTLSGVPPEDARSLSLQIVAEYEEHQLSQIFTIPLVADDGIRGLSSDAIMAGSEGVSPVAATQTPTTTKQSQSLQASTSSVGSERTASTNSIATPPSTYLGQSSGSSNATSGSALLPSPMTAGSGMLQEMGNGSTSHVPGPSYPKLQTSFLQQNTGGNMRSGPSSPISPQQPGFQGGMQTRLQPPQPVPFYLPASHPTDATTLNNALHIKAKLVETTTVHHDNLSALNPAHPPADPAKVERAVDAAISHQLAVTSHRPQMPSATEVFNATLEVSTRSQQMQQEQLSQVVAAVTQQIQQQQAAHSIPPMPVPAANLPLSSQVTSQLADFSFTTPSTTPNNRSPDVSFHAHHHGHSQ